jgi:serine protease Do
MRDLPLIIAEMPIGRSADVTVWRGNREITLRPVISLMPDEQETAEFRAPQTAPLAKLAPDITAGLKLAPLTAQLRKRLQVPKDVSGAVVAAIPDDSPLSGADLLPGDIIEMINQEPVASPRDAFAKLRSATTRGKTVMVLVNRHGSNHYVALSRGEQPGGSAPG